MVVISGPIFLSVHRAWILWNKLPQVACDLCKLQIPCHIDIHGIVRRSIPTPRLLFRFENTFSRHWLSSCLHSLLLVVDRVAVELRLHLILPDLHQLLFSTWRLCRSNPVFQHLTTFSSAH